MKDYDPIPQRAEAAARIIVDAAYRVHAAIGPGLLESVYEVCLCHELNKQGIPFLFNKYYQSFTMGCGLMLVCVLIY